MGGVILAVVGVLGTGIGVWAFVDTRRNRRIKLLAYEHTAPFPLATARRHTTDYELSIQYRTAEGKREVIDAAFVTYLFFANFGKEPIREADIAPSNPLRIEVEGGRVLDISLSGANRDVNRISVEEIKLGATSSAAKIRFDFLDFKDGGLIRVLATSRRIKIRLVGDIIGMPEGVRRTDQPTAKGPWGKIGFGLWVTSEIIALAGAVYIYRLAQGGLENVWVLGLPFLALLIPAAVAMVLAVTVWPLRAGARSYPKELLPPRQFLLRDPMAVEYPEFFLLDGEGHRGDRP